MDFTVSLGVPRQRSLWTPAALGAALGAGLRTGLRAGLLASLGIILLVASSPAQAGPAGKPPPGQDPAPGVGAEAESESNAPERSAPSAEDNASGDPAPGDKDAVSTSGGAPEREAPEGRASPGSPDAPDAPDAPPPSKDRVAAQEGAPQKAREVERPEAKPRPEALRPRTSTGDDDRDIEEKPMRRLQGTAWAMVGVTAVLLTVTGIFALLVEDREDDVERMATYLDPYDGGRPLPYSGITKRDFEQFHKEGRRFQTAAFTFLGLTAAAAIGATTLFVVDHLTKNRERPKRTLRIDPVLGPRGAGIGLGMEF